MIIDDTTLFHLDHPHLASPRCCASPRCAVYCCSSPRLAVDCCVSTRHRLLPPIVVINLVMQKNYEVLLVSQFTLYGVLKGNKPDFHVAMPPAAAKSFYASLVERFQKAYGADAVKDGLFGAMMTVNLVNDGPVTMQLESRES
ncbi:uncharacterized protein LOC130997987 [Salvia miltiorrhiza]|uniref:uncharacterized protein LOC130997987 n=1 Tax=Salvia miltiorrhiza TaxID=226208 RepID=UPI0025AD40ED|nr:uncharacterized protein LOC130997987 [Salvia miltiorrhiza]